MSMQKKIEISVIIVHYGGGAEVKKCLKAVDLIRKKTRSAEFIFVDNNEKENDEIKDNFPWLRYYKTNKNLGWGGGRNFGVKHSSGKYLLHLDSDIVIDYKSFTSLLNFIKKHKDAGVVSPLLNNISGKFSPSATLELTPLRAVFYLSFINSYFNKSSIIQNYLISEWNRKSDRKVDVAQLGAFLMERKLYKKIGGFDEKMFLYFEENDFSLKIKKQKKNLYIVTNAKALHLESKGTPKSSEKIKSYYCKSRFRYFSKNYGLAQALIVELFTRVSKLSLVLVLTLAIGAFLRFCNLEQNLIFNGEMGTDYMNVWKMLHGERSFLIGPRTSHEWFFIPPLAYWIYAALLFFSNWDPVVVNIFWAVVGSLAIWVSYFYAKKIFETKTSIITSLFIAVSPAWVQLTRDSRYNAPAAILFFPYFWYLLESLKDNGKSLFKLGLVLGLCMSFFPSPILLIPAVVISFLLYKLKPKINYILKGVLGFLIPNITFFIYDSLNGFEISKKILLWVPYRVAGFFGLYEKNTVTQDILSKNIFSIFQFFNEQFFVNTDLVFAAVFALVIILSTILFMNSLKTKKIDAFVVLIVNLFVAYIGLFIHGDPPKHYYLVIFPIPILIASYLITKFFKNVFQQVSLVLIFVAFCVYSLTILNWFYQNVSPPNYQYFPVPYSLQLEISQKILQDSTGKTFGIKRIGVNDKFENDFANNYIYLLTIRGVRPQSYANLLYTIVEDENSPKTPVGVKIWEKEGIKIYKYEKD